MAKQEANDLLKLDFSILDSTTARALATPILDAAQIPHGDLSILSNTVHSGRFFISQWQRSAVGSTIVVFGKNETNDLLVVLGKQRGTLNTPQGYMEVPLPIADLTGLKSKHASRMNGKTLEVVNEDESIEANAIREIYEETSIQIQKKDLILLGIVSDTTSSPVCIAAQYMVILDNIPTLYTIDDEFPDDDLARPIWSRVSDIKYLPSKQQYFTNKIPNIPLHPSAVKIIKLALQKLNIPLLLISSEEEILNELQAIENEGVVIITNKQYKQCADYIKKFTNLVTNYKILCEDAIIDLTTELNEKFIAVIKLHTLTMQKAVKYISEESNNSSKIGEVYNILLEKCIISNNALLEFCEKMLQSNNETNPEYLDKNLKDIMTLENIVITDDNLSIIGQDNVNA